MKVSKQYKALKYLGAISPSTARSCGDAQIAQWETKEIVEPTQSTSIWSGNLYRMVHTRKNPRIKMIIKNKQHLYYCVTEIDL